MKRHLLWKLLLNIIPVIFLTILVVWLAIDHLAAAYFMRLMENYSIEPLDSHRMFIEAVHRYLLWAALAALALALTLSYLMTKRVLRPLSQMPGSPANWRPVIFPTGWRWFQRMKSAS